MAIVNSELLRRARVQADDMVEPYFTDDETFMTYLSEAEREICSSGRMLRKELTFAVSGDMRYIDYSDVAEVIELRAAEIIDEFDNHWRLNLQGVTDYVPDNTRYDYGLSPAVLKTGRPAALIFGRVSDNFELSPLPDQDYTLSVQVIHYPDEPISASGGYPTIPERYHHLIPVGAALRAVETYTQDQEAQTRLANLNQQWARAVERTRRETAIISRDGGNVRFNNDMWWGSY